MATPQEIPARSPIGRDTRRVEGPLKVTGKAQYASDFHFPGLLYAVPVEATIANGKVTKLDTAAAEKMPGVRAIFHRDNIGQTSRATHAQPPRAARHDRCLGGLETDFVRVNAVHFQHPKRPRANVRFAAGKRPRGDEIRRFGVW